MTSPADAAIAYAKAQIGKPYRYGFQGPDAFDCSGLVMMAYRAGGIRLPRTSEAMLGVGIPIGRNELQPGDLVFPDSGHVQLYVGTNTIIEAPRTGLNVREVPMWGFMTARRVTTPGSSIFDTVTNPVKSVLSNGATVGQNILTGELNGLTALQDNLGSAVAGVINTLPGVQQIETVGLILQKLSDKKIWMRIGIGAGGVVMILFGAALLGRKQIARGGAAIATEGTSEVVRAVGKSKGVSSDTVRS